MTANDLLSGVLRLRGSGLATIPIKADGSKQPAVSSWKQYEQRLPTEGELRKWFGNGKRRGIALIGGKVSGNLEILDFDAPELIVEWRELVEETAPGLLDRLPQVQTPAGGLHIFYRCARIAGNAKLAQREIEVSEGTKGARSRDGRWFKVETTIETRGEGGYVITAGSPAACHPSGKSYQLINGDLKAVPEITEREREILLDCARSFNEHIKQAPDPKREQSEDQSSGLRPGDDFNQRGDVRALLEKHGWKYLRPGPRGELWRRPDGDHTSATLFSDGSLYVFSSNAHPFDHDRVYRPFSIYSLLEHDGDWKAAAKALITEGFGAPKKAKKKDKPKAGSGSVEEVGKITFEVNEKGVWATHENDIIPTWVCSQLIIEADTRDERNVNWGRLLKFPDRDGVWHTWSMPMELLAGDGREFRQYLLNQGLDIGGRKSRAMLEAYLNIKSDKRALCVTKPGWHRGGFVLPDEFISGDDDEPIYLQTFTANHLFRQKGSAEDWRETLGRFCSGNSRLLLAVSAAFCAPLLDPLRGENGGWHFTGGTSLGKSTALYVAGSVHGGGDKGFLRRWRATINGLESVAESHHDSLLCLDEIAECKPEDVNEAAYMLSNGQGKARQSRAGGLRVTPEWRVVFLSSGEISLADHVAQSGRRVRGGQEVRVINLPADAGKGFGLFEDLHGFADGDEFSRYMQRAARDCYGAPIRAFLRSLVGRLDNLRERYKTFSDETLAEMLPSRTVGEVSRVAHRFALAAFAGELATELGLTGWEPDEATAAAKALFQAWLDTRGTSGSADEEAAVRQVRAFLEQHGASRFQRLFISQLSDAGKDKAVSKDRAVSSEDQTVSEDRAVINRAGYIKPKKEKEGVEIAEYFILPEVFRNEVCKGFDPRMVARALKEKGLLTSDSQADRLTRKLRTPEGNLWVYCVSSRIHEKIDF